MATKKKVRKAKKAKKAATKAKGNNLVAGRYRQGTAMAALFNALAPGKTLTLAVLRKKCPKVNLPNRLRALVQHGKETKHWTVTSEKGNVQMVLKNKKLQAA